MENSNPDAYADVERALDEALAAPDPAAAAAARQKAHLLLARAAASPSFDPRRSRAISRALEKAHAPAAGAPVAPLLTR